MFRPSLIPLRSSSLCRPSFHYLTVRYGSLNSAIERGLRKSRSVDDSTPRHSYNKDYRGNGQKDDKHSAVERGPRKSRSLGDAAPWHSYNRGRHANGRREYRPRIAEEEPTDVMFDESEFIRSGLLPSMMRGVQHPPQRSPAKVLAQNLKARRLKRRVGRHHPSDGEPERIKSHVKPPTSIPYTTPASEFIYGTNAVEAALRCSRRQLYALYVYQGEGEDLGTAKSTVRKLALSKGVKVKMAFAEWADILDEMSQDRPHNGLILEASPLPQLPVTSFRAVSSIEDSHFRVDLDRQTREEAAVNGSDNRIPIFSQHRRRYPVVLLLDGIVDTGNLGGIVRSAYFLGIDALVFAGRNSAPLNPVAIKASAGAAENMTILSVSNEVAFIKQSKANGWRFYAADAPGLGSTLFDPLAPTDGSSGPSFNHLTQAPSVLMMGSEASGLSPHIKSHADSIVSIPGARLERGIGVSSDPARVDSLNVSVAAALLMEMFLRLPVAVSEVPAKGGR